MKIKFNELFPLFIVLEFCSFFTTSSINILNIFGYFCIILIILISVLYTLIILLKKSTSKQIVSYIFILVIIIYLLSQIELISNGLVYITQIVSILCVITLTSNFCFDNINLRTLKKINTTIIILSYLIVSIRILFNINIMFNNIASIAPYSIGLFLINYMIKECLNKSYSISYSILYFPLLLLSDGRNGTICIFIFFFMYKFGAYRILKSKIRDVIFFFVLICVVYLITIEYPKLYGTSLGIEIDVFIKNLTGKNFFSGRQVIWKNIILAVNEHELFGLGTGVLYSNISTDLRSAHNQYLQIYIQNGVIGISFLIFYIYTLWRRLIVLIKHYPKQFFSRFSLSFLVAFIWYNIFSVAMFQNSMATAVMMWTIVAIGLKERSV